MQNDGNTVNDRPIINGRVVDGSGAPAFNADVGIRNGRIAAIGKLATRQGEAKRVIDAGGRVVAPGFIDSHTHLADPTFADDLDAVIEVHNDVAAGLSSAGIGWGFTVGSVLSVAAILGVLAGPPVVAMLAIDPAAAAALRDHAAASGGAILESAKAIPTVAQFVVDLVPTNPVKAAADGAMLPLIVFALAFGGALARVQPGPRAALLGALRGVERTSLMLVRWVLAAAPLGVLALAIALGAKLGLAAIGALLTYVALVSGASALFCVLVLYPVVVLFGGLSLRAFARGALPGQAVAFSSRSSLAALPAMLDSARHRLHLDERVTSFLLPLSVALFRCGAAIGQTIGAIFVALLPPTIAILRDGIPATFADLSSATGIPVFQFVGNALGAFFKKPGVEAGIFGLILVLVILLEPLGIYGRWMKIRLFFSTFPMYKRATFKRQKTYMKSERLR